MMYGTAFDAITDSRHLVSPPQKFRFHLSGTPETMRNAFSAQGEYGFLVPVGIDWTWTLIRTVGPNEMIWQSPSGVIKDVVYKVTGGGRYPIVRTVLSVNTTQAPTGAPPQAEVVAPYRGQEIKTYSISEWNHQLADTYTDQDIKNFYNAWRGNLANLIRSDNHFSGQIIGLNDQIRKRALGLKYLPAAVDPGFAFVDPAEFLSIGGRLFWNRPGKENIPIPPAEQYDLWQFRDDQTGADSEYIYKRTTLRNMTNGNTVVIDWREKSGSTSFGDIVKDISIKDVSRGIVALSTVGQSEVWRAGAETAGVSEKTIDDLTLAGAALATAIATYGVGSSLLAPTTAAGGAVAAGGAEAAAATGAATAATATGTTAAATTVGGVIAKTVAAAATAVGSQAVTAGLQKLTGQLDPNDTPLVEANVPPAEEAPTPKSKAPFMVAAGVLIAAILANRS